MSITVCQVLHGTDHNNLNDQLAEKIAAGYQPLYGSLVVAPSGAVYITVIKGTPDTNNLASAAAGVLNGDTVAVHNSAGADSHNATAEVSGNTLSDVKFAATVAMVDNADTVVVHNSAGATVTGTHTAEVAAGALTDVKLAATVAPVLNGQALTGVTPTGAFLTTVTFTVANGAITAIALS